mgnify:CR=1 FL=1
MSAKPRMLVIGKSGSQLLKEAKKTGALVVAYRRAAANRLLKRNRNLCPLVQGDSVTMNNNAIEQSGCSQFYLNSITQGEMCLLSSVQLAGSGIASALPSSTISASSPVNLLTVRHERHDSSRIERLLFIERRGS